MATIQKPDEKRPAPIHNPCPGSVKNAVAHNLIPTRVPLYLHHKSGVVVKAAEGSTCCWSGWDEGRKRYLECWNGFYNIKEYVSLAIKGLTRAVWQKEMTKGPSYIHAWGYHLRETESGSWENFNTRHVNHSLMIYQKEGAPRMKPEESKDAFQPELP